MRSEPHPRPLPSCGLVCAQVQAFTDVESSLQRAVTSLSRDRSMPMAGLAPISEADSTSVSKRVTSKQSRMCQSDTPQPVRVMAARGAAGGKGDACATLAAHHHGPARPKTRPRGNTPAAAPASDMYNFPALAGSAAAPDLYSFAAAANDGSGDPTSSSDAAAESRASSRRNSLQSMKAAAERNNPYAALASSLGGMNATVVSGGPMANSFASAGARVGGAPMPSVRPAPKPPVSMGDSFANANARVGGLAMPSVKITSRLSVVSPFSGNFATADARVGGLAMPKRSVEPTILEGSGSTEQDVEVQRGEAAAATSVGGPAAGAAKATNPYAGILNVALGADPSPAAATHVTDSAGAKFSALSAPLLTVAPHKGDDDDDQPPPNPFASSAKRSEPQMVGWRQLTAA